MRGETWEGIWARKDIWALSLSRGLPKVKVPGEGTQRLMTEDDGKDVWSKGVV